MWVITKYSDMSPKQQERHKELIKKCAKKHSDKISKQYVIHMLSVQLKCPCSIIRQNEYLIDLKWTHLRLNRFKKQCKNKKMKATAKELLKNLADTLDKLKKGEIKVSQASATAYLSKQALGLLQYEVQRATALSETAIKDQFREIEESSLT